MVSAPPLAQMRAEFDSLLDAGWGVNCRISRLSATTDSEGELSGGFATLTSGERLWIQPIAGRSMIDTKSLDAETTHLCFQKHSGTPLFPKDRILPSGEVYVYDVKHAHILESHRMSELKQDLRA
jgi:hypothetical protein